MNKKKAHKIAPENELRLNKSIETYITKDPLFICVVFIVYLYE